MMNLVGNLLDCMSMKEARVVSINVSTKVWNELALANNKRPLLVAGIPVYINRDLTDLEVEVIRQCFLPDTSGIDDKIKNILAGLEKGIKELLR